MASIRDAQIDQADVAVAPDLTITLDPHRPGRHRARLVHFGVPVWALIAYLQGVDWDVAQTAHASNIPEEAVQAAIDHYRADPKYIDAFLLLNEDYFTA